MRAAEKFWRTPSLLFVGVYLFSGLSRVATSFDSRWTVYTAMSLWTHGDLNLDEYGSAIRANSYYALQCVDSEGRISLPAAGNCRGHWYHVYPMGGPILESPLIAGAVGALRALGPVLGRIHGTGVIGGFLRGDYDAGHSLLEMEIASAMVAAAAVLLYWTARRYLAPGRAVWLAALFGVASPAYSIAGRALWQHTPSLLLLTLILYLLTRAEDKPPLAAWAGIPVALSFTVRPTDALFVVVFTAYVAVRHRAHLFRYLMAAAPVALLFVVLDYRIYHSLLSPYYGTPFRSLDQWRVSATALAGNLVSPSRGLLVFTPVFAFSIGSMLRRNWKAPLAPWLAALALLQWIVISCSDVYWWGGHSYGQRYFTDVVPVFTLFLIPYLEKWPLLPRPLRTAFVALALAGFAIHLRGGWSAAVYDWNVSPVNVDHAPQRVWDWSDPQFARAASAGRTPFPARPAP